MHRRALLAVPLLAVPLLALPIQVAAAPHPDILQPNAPLDQDMARLAVGAGFTFPALRARVLSVLHVTGAEITAAAFGADTQDTRQDWLALVGPSGALLALDLLSWSGPANGSIATHVAVMPDHRHITLERAAARHASHGGWLRETWTDYWLWTGSGLTNAPPRPILAGTWQHALSIRRAALAKSLTPTRNAITQGMLAEALAPPNPLAGSAFPE